MTDNHIPLPVPIRSDTVIIPPASGVPRIIAAAGKSAQFAWDEFFKGEIANAHTRKNYLHDVQQFLAWCKHHSIPLIDIEPGHIGEYFSQFDLAVPTKKLHLAALRKFFDRLVNRHVIVLNPAATVRAERYSAVEGKTPEMQKQQAEKLLKSIDTAYQDESGTQPDRVGLRDQAILAVLVFTAARVGAVAKLTFKSLRNDGT